MTYTKKPGAPTVIDLGQALAAEIVGTDAAWMGGFIPFLGQDIVDVDAMCRAGPPVYSDLNPLDFVGLPIGPASAVGKLQRNAVALVFPTYCENVGVAGAYGAETCATMPGPSSPQASVPQVIATAPAGATMVRIRPSACDPTPNDGWPIQWGISSTGSTGWGQALERPFTNANLAAFATAGYAWQVPVTRGDTITQRIYTGGAITTCVSFNVGGSAPIPTPSAPEPAGLPIPPQFQATDISGLSAALDDLRMLVWNLQACCDTLMDRMLLEGSPDAAPVADAAADQIADLAGAKGFLIAVSGRPDYLGSQPDDPPRFFRMGRYTLGTATGWGLSVPIEHESTTVEPLPLGTTRVGVHVNPPMSASITTLR